MHSITKVLLLICILFFGGCEEKVPEENDVNSSNATVSKGVIVRLKPSQPSNLSIVLIANKEQFNIGEQIIVQVRVENTSFNSPIAFNVGSPWYRYVVIIVDKEFYEKAQNTGNPNYEICKLPDGSDSWYNTLLIQNEGSSRFLYYGDVLEHEFRYTAKRPGKYIAVAMIDSNVGTDHYPTGKAPNETVEVPIQGFIKFKTKPIILNFEVIDNK